MNVLAAPRVHVWTRGEYHKLVSLGFFDGQHVELIEGQVVDTQPMGSLHATAVALVARELERAFGAGYFVRWQMPFGVGDLSEPEPDVAVVEGDIRDYVDAHPRTAVLVVEVADTSLDFDRPFSPGGDDAQVALLAHRTGRHIEGNDSLQQPCPVPSRRGATGVVPIAALLTHMVPVRHWVA